MLNLEDDNLQLLLKFLQSRNVAHSLKQCPSSTTIKVGVKTYHFSVGEKISAAHLNFIKKTKKELCHNAEKLGRFEDKERPAYIGFTPTFEGDFSFDHGQYVELDIVGAYWKTAFDFGLISEDTYKHGNEVPKGVRLMALGSAASVKEEMRFDGEKYIFVGIEKNDHGRNAFFRISKHIDNLLKECLQVVSSEGAFFWVDAVFIRRKWKDFIIETLNGKGYQIKEIDIYQISGNIEKSFIEVISIKSKHEKSKLFCFEIKKYFKNGKKTIKKTSKKP